MVARRSLLALAVLLAAAGLTHAADDSVGRLRKDLTYLTSDECEGRGAQTQGLHKAADYIAGEFQKAGLKPGGPNHSYFQPFRMASGQAKLTGSKVVLRGPLGQEIELKAGEQFQPVGLSASGKVSAPVVFAGYGISAPDLKYDDFAGADVAGKVVIVLRKTPRPGNTTVPFGDQRNDQLASLSGKVVAADQAKAAAVLFVNDRDTVGGFLGDRLMPFGYTVAADMPAKIPSVHVRRSVVESMLQGSVAKELRTVEADIDRDLKPQTMPLTGWTATVEVDINRPTVEVKNVIGVLPGSGPLANEYVVIGAHYDHLGRGERGSLERDQQKRTQIHRGADDNGSGTVAVVELARRLAGRKYEGRTLVFMTFSGEEQGLLGSKYFCEHPTVPLEKVVAMVNLDMVGRVRPDRESKLDKLDVGGVGTAKEFIPLIDELNQKYRFQLAKSPGGLDGMSDHSPFARKRVPVFFFFTGMHPEYHRPADTVDTINFEGIKKVVDLTGDLVGRLATQPARPQFVEVKGPSMPRTRAEGPRLGIMPGNYNETEEKGVLVDGVSENGPAAKAGLKAGDYIVEIGGKPVKNITAYMTVMAGQKKGQPLELTVLRKAERLKIKVTPE